MYFFKKMGRFNIPYFLTGFFILFVVTGLVLTVWFSDQESSVQLVQASQVVPVVDSADLVSRLTLEEKVGQILMVNYYGDDEAQLKSLFKQCHPGGIMLKGENTADKSFEGLKRQNKWLQSFSPKVPIWISVDQEGGSVARLRGVLKNYPSPPLLFRRKGVKGVEDQAIYYAEKLKELGIQINFSPVVDVVENSHSIVADRSFSSSPQTNTMLAALYVKRFREEGVIAVPKHFPGYGDIAVDPHDSLSVDSSTNLEQMEKAFSSVLDADLIMTSHVIYEAFDRLPGTLSPIILGHLRKAGFTNLIISDDIQMKSITLMYDYDKAAIKAVQAGCDIVLSIEKNERNWLDSVVRLHSALVQAYRDGQLDKDLLDKRVEKILNLKFRSNSRAVWTLLTDSERNALGLGVQPSIAIIN